MKYFEITNCDPYSKNYGKTVVWSLRKCQSYYGKDEFEEHRQGYHPALVIAEVPKPENYIAPTAEETRGMLPG